MMGLTSNEIHAFVIGAAETFCPWPPRYKLLTNDNSFIKAEYHYYLAGRDFGFVALLLLLVGIAKLIQEVLL